MVWETALAEALKWVIIITAIAGNIVFVVWFLIKYLYRFFFEEDEKGLLKKREGNK